MKREFSVPVKWLGILPDFGGGHEVVVEAVDGKGYYWDFHCVIRKGEGTSKPVFQSRGWLKFVNKKGLQVGDKITLYKKEDRFRGTKYKIRAQKRNGEGMWVDV
ncbi:hypothetical protein L484_001540 [Morus notabilis]|uniref:TF-B3 domain-containing protein n=1 Tax=Morus notabilis TaxID=981085 RepID=W9QX63_9ROSA|nr:hypothetical protein L484_001540 [Morus notabilis]